MKKCNAISLFCESIRQEFNDQQTLVGVLSDSISVSNLPGQIPMLAIYTRINFAIGEDISALSVDFISPDGAVISHNDLDLAIIEQSKREAMLKEYPSFGLITTLTITNFPVLSAGVFTVEVTADKDKFLAGILGIRLVPYSA